jgi:hypothetical protein
MGRSRTAPLLVTGVTVIAGALLVVVTPGETARLGMYGLAALPDSYAHLPWSTALRTPAPESSPVPTTNVTRGPAYLALTDSSGPVEWPPRRIEPPAVPAAIPGAAAPAYAMPVPRGTDAAGPRIPKTTGPPPPTPEAGWSPAPAWDRSAGAARVAAPEATPGTEGTGSDRYLVVGAILLLAGGGLIVLARGIEAARPRRRRRGAHHRI